MNIIIIFSFLYCAFQLPYYVYLFQIKEYRFDRIKVFIQESGFLQFFLNISFKLPAKTLRNFLIILFSFFLFIYIYAIVYFFNSLIAYLLLILLTPFITFFTVSISTIITHIFANIKRRHIILQAKQQRSQSKTMFIGITGSYGKTTTKELLFQLLSTSFSVEKTNENMNTDVGVALSIKNSLKSNTQYFIAEMGAYRLGEIKTICDIIQPTYGIITGIGNQHLALFGSLHNIIKTKSELLNSLPKNGVAYVINDVSFEYLQKQAKCRIVSFGTNNSDITLKEKSIENGSTYKITYKKNTFTINTPFPKQFLSNLLPVIGLSIDLGVSQEKITQTLPILINKLYDQLIKVSNLGMKIINSSYNVNVEGFIGMIELIKSFERKNNIIVSKGIIELGAEKKSSYKKIVTKLNNSNAMLLTTDPLFFQLKNKNNIRLFNNEDQILSKIISYRPKETSLSIIGRFSQKFIKQL